MSTPINDGGQAFPHGDPTHGGDLGMSLRDFATIKILAGFCANPAIFAPNGMRGWGLVNCTDQDIVGYSAHLADLVLDERKQKKETLP